jgi:hypothetical protein
VRIRPKIPGSVAGSAFSSLFNGKWTSRGDFCSCLKTIQDFLVPGRFLVNLVSFVPYSLAHSAQVQMDLSFGKNVKAELSLMVFENVCQEFSSILPRIYQ